MIAKALLTALCMTTLLMQDVYQPLGQFKDAKLFRVLWPPNPAHEQLYVPYAGCAPAPGSVQGCQGRVLHPKHRLSGESREGDGRLGLGKEATAEGTGTTGKGARR